MTEKSNLERVVTNVVNIQQTIFLQFEQLTKSMETLRLDNAKAISELREDIRRTEDRTQSQFNKETERLHSIINILLAKDSGVPQQPMANPPNPNVAMMVQHQQALMFQQHQQQLAQQQAIQQAELQRALVNASMQSAIANATTKPVPPPVVKMEVPSSATPAAPVPTQVPVASTPAQVPAAPTPAQVPVASIPVQVPAAASVVGTSTPVKAPVAVEKPKKVEVKENDENDVKIPFNAETKGFGDKFKPPPGSWECKGCYIQNKADVEVCPSCSTGKDGKPADKSANIFNKSVLRPLNVPTPSNGTPKMSFGFTAAAVAKEQNTPKTSLFGGNSSATDKSTSLFSKTLPRSLNDPAPANGTPKMSFGFSAAAAAKEPNTPKTSQFGGALNGASPSVFGAGAAKTSIFGGSSPATGAPSFSFNSGSASKPAGTPLFNFNKTAEPATPVTNKEDDENEETEEYEPQVEFAPVVPLPDLVDVKTGEEDEEIVFKARCKLFRYIQATQENKERGVGDIKILTKDGKYRVVMRRDQVLKICANFRVDKSIKLSPKAGYSNVFTFMCQDFSDSEESSECHVFTIKFKDEKIAGEFKEKFTECQANLA